MSDVIFTLVKRDGHPLAKLAAILHALFNRQQRKSGYLFEGRQ